MVGEGDADELAHEGGQEVQAAANAISACGAGKFLGVAGEDFAPSRYATDAAAAGWPGVSARPKPDAAQLWS